METKNEFWSIPLNGATKNWQENVMWHGGTGFDWKTVHVNDGSKLCCISTYKNISNKKLKMLFKKYFGIDVIGDEIKHRM